MGGRALAFPLVGALALAALYARSATSGSDAVVSFQTDSVALTGAVPQLHLRSEYEEALGRQIGDGLYPHLNLVELHSETSLSLKFPGAAAVDVGELSWTLAGTDGEEGFAPVGPLVRARFNALGKHRVVAVSSHGVEYSFHCTARYVRREIRDLSATDRGRYFDALAVVYFTSQSDGVQLYGEDFKSASWLVREHLYGAADKACDHWHDDAGFLNHHVGITMQLEQSLQAVDFTTSSHYWDYTLDAVLGDDYTSSIMFDSDWFGAADPQPSSRDDDHVVSVGRFAYTPVLNDARGAFSNVTNSFGLLRSPWNTNSVPFLLRSRYTMGVRDALYSMPACADFAAVLVKDNLSFASVSTDLNGALHGMVHIMLGGHWWANASFVERMADHVTDMRSSPHIADQFLLGSKFLWRQGFVRCPETCDSEECACNCPAEVTLGHSAEEIFHMTGLLAIVPEIETLLVNKIGFSWEEVFAEMCHVGHPGEMYTSAAPQDPIFWPLHGLSERFVQLIRLLAAKNVLDFDDSWDYAHVKSVLSDTRVVCDWTEVEALIQIDPQANAFAKPTCRANTTCPGHKATDVLPFTDLHWSKGTVFTNEEFYQATSPSNEDLPYVYDKLTTWPACVNSTILPNEWYHVLDNEGPDASFETTR